MSRRALSLAVVNQLRDATTGLSLTVKECGLTPLNGMPPRACGERYVGVRVGSRSRNKEVTHGLDETYTVIVTVTFRIMGKVPFDRLGIDLMEKASFGFDNFVDQIRANLHPDYYDGRVLSRANTLLNFGTDNAGYGFVEGLQFLGDDDPGPVGGSWFGADEGEQPVGIVQNLKFGGARRIQSFRSSQGVT